MADSPGILARLFDHLRGSESTEYTHFRLNEPGASPPAIRANEQYLRVWLRSARITHERRWTTKYRAGIHARFELNHPIHGRSEVVSVVSPDKLFEDADPSHLDRLLVVNQLLLGPVPYLGELGTEIGLFSVKSTDLAKPYLELLASLTQAAGVSLLAKASPWAAPIRRGVEMLFAEEGNAVLEIGLARTETNLATGHWIVARVPKSQLDSKMLRLDPEDFSLRDSQGASLTEFPYLVLGIEAFDSRDDYASIPDIREGWEAIRSAVAEAKLDEEVLQRFESFRRRIHLSHELVPADRRRVVEIFARQLRDAGFDLAAAPSDSMATRSDARVRPRSTLPLVEDVLTPSTMRAGDVTLCDAHAVDERSSSSEDFSSRTKSRKTSVTPARSILSRGSWRLAVSLEQLRRNVNALAPNRSKRSDGAIGDAAHSTRDSDHNPWIQLNGIGVVTAIDITHDPNGGCDAEHLAHSLISSRDARIKYVIWNGQIFSATVQPWTWRRYGGRNPHDHHIHISVQATPERFDDASDWSVTV